MVALTTLQLSTILFAESCLLWISATRIAFVLFTATRAASVSVSLVWTSSLERFKSLASRSTTVSFVVHALEQLMRLL